MRGPAGELWAHDQPAIEDVHGESAFPAGSVARRRARRGRVPRERRAQSGAGAGRDAGGDHAGEELAQDGLAVEVIELFDALPGTKALKFWAPPDAGRPAWSAASDAGSPAGHRQRLQGLRPGRVSPSGRGRPRSDGPDSACRATGRADAGGVGTRRERLHARLPHLQSPEPDGESDGAHRAASDDPGER